jgi:hypothetical protein
MISVDKVSLYLFFSFRFSNFRISNCQFFVFFCIFVVDVTRYAKFVDQAVVDGKVRSIPFIINDTSVVAVLPHFWYYVGMKMLGVFFVFFFWY